ncbi:MAG TPA: DUF3800 domain-containing protein [Thermoanaerobaculia bacterium]
MYQAFFDESQADAVYLIAGWVAAADEWTKFDAAWNTVLTAKPTIRYFRHHDAKTRKGEFSGWTAEEVDAKLTALVEVICHYDMYGVATGVNTQTWNRAFRSKVLSPKRLRGLLKITHYYESCFHSAIGMVMQRQMELGYVSDVIDLIFDQQDGLLNESMKHYSEFKKAFPSQLQKIAGKTHIGNDRECPALQAADLLAGQLTTMLRSGPAPTYQKLVGCHEVLQTTAYPPGFHTFPALVNAVSWAWNERRNVNAEIAAAERRSRDDD